MPRPTPEFKQLLDEAFAQIQDGDIFVFRRTFTEGDVALFCGVTGDYNPYHLDERFAAASPYGGRIIPGLLTSSMIPHIGGMIGFIATEMSFEYLAPVYLCDTITCTVTYSEKDEARRRIRGEGHFVNQGGTDVLRARFSGFPSQVRLQPQRS